MDEAGHDPADELTLEPVAVDTPRRRRALWGVLVATVTAAAALSVVSAGDDGGDSTPLPVALGAAGMEATGAADAMFRAVTYVPGDDLPALGGTAAAYRVTGTVDEAAVIRLARALGLGAAPVHDGTTWHVAAPDGGYLEVSEGYGAMWWFGAAGGGVGQPGSSGGGGVESCIESSDDVVTDCAVRPTTTVVANPTCAGEPCPGPAECPPGTSCSVTCVTADAGARCDAPPPPDACASSPADDTGCFPPDCTVASDGTRSCPEPSPADLPSEDEARQIALDLLTAAGMDTADAIVRVDGPYEAWYVSVETRVDGLPSGLHASVSVGGRGAVLDASGFLGMVEKAGDYPLLDTRAAIERGNQQMPVPMMAATDELTPALGEPGTRSSSSGAGAESPVTTIVSSDPVCTDEDLAADRCGSQVVDPPVTTVPCKVQPDGREICEVPDPPVCSAEALPGTQPVTECPPISEPEILEVVLVDAEPALILIGANDGTSDAYLVPAYRFTAEDGTAVDFPAVADEALAPTPGPPVTDTPVTPTYQQQCQILVEGDESGTTHTVQPSPDCISPDPIELPAGEEPAVGVGYYVDVDLQCGGGSFELGGRVWRTDDPAVAEWAPGERFEGGTFTLEGDARGTFVGDLARTKVAEFHPLGPAEDIFCQPQRRP